MKERFLNVLAWGVWLNALGWLFIFLFHASQEGGIRCGSSCADDYLAVAAVTLLPLVAQWVLFYIVTGSPRFLPWRK